MEVISEDSLRNDMEHKPPLYATRLPTPIIARRLNDAANYQAIPMVPDGSYPSEIARIRSTFLMHTSAWDYRRALLRRQFDVACGQCRTARRTERRLCPRCRKCRPVTAG